MDCCDVFFLYLRGRTFKNHEKENILSVGLNRWPYVYEGVQKSS